MSDVDSTSLKEGVAPQAERPKRSKLLQTDVPAFDLKSALRVPAAVVDNFAKSPTKPLRVAHAMNMQPSSSQFRMITGAAIAYGLTEGGYNADTISLTPLARRILVPTKLNDDVTAKREALLRPRVIGEFLSKYNGSKLPPERIALNVLEEMGVPAERTKQTLSLIYEGARSVGFFRELKGVTYVDLDADVTSVAGVGTELANEDDMGEFLDDDANGGASNLPGAIATSPAAPLAAAPPSAPNNRVFITHGKNREIVGQLKELLTFGSFVPVISVEQEGVSKPVPDKVMDEMRSCNAAIIHVGTELRLLDGQGKEYRVLNPNVLIEIGAAMALYKGKFILLVEKGTELPSNLQGLYEVRYEGDKLDYESTMKLLKAFNDFRK